MDSNSPWWPGPVQAPSPTTQATAAPATAAPPAVPAEREQPWPAFGAPLDPPEPTAGRRGKPRGRLGALAAAIVAFLAKFKAILLLLPKLKLLTTLGTMLVSVAAYSFVFGWTFAVGFVVLLLVHEMGHVIALRREGIKASAPMFIPFMGAVISARSLGSNALAEARVGLAGPILGSIGSAACIAIWHATGNDLWRALAFTGFFLNLFNLLPVVPLDGGRAMAAMAPWMWFVGFAAMVPLAFIFPNPIIFLILLFAGYETYKRWKLRQAGGAQQEAYYRVRPLDRALVAAVYLSLIALLVVGMHATTLTRTFA
ncbi:MAG TPA: site-2 protease family protein [Solirubrobacteraceae bacterium]|nr:site-2 protease family protein [Solirubrobacteraceae bacterium]